MALKRIKNNSDFIYLPWNNISDIDSGAITRFTCKFWHFYQTKFYNRVSAISAEAVNFTQKTLARCDYLRMAQL